VKLGDELVLRTVREPRNAARAWALGRLGARNPLYGPLNNVVPASAAERWIERLLELKSIPPDVAAVVVQLGALTGDPARDVPVSLRQRAIETLSAAGVPGEALAPLEQVVPVSRASAGRAFGEPLPEGLRLESD
jgi:hypothetical protein